MDSFAVASHSQIPTKTEKKNQQKENTVSNEYDATQH